MSSPEAALGKAEGVRLAEPSRMITWVHSFFDPWQLTFKNVLHIPDDAPADKSHTSPS